RVPDPLAPGHEDVLHVRFDGQGAGAQVGVVGGHRPPAEEALPLLGDDPLEQRLTRGTGRSGRSGRSGRGFDLPGDEDGAYPVFGGVRGPSLGTFSGVRVFGCSGVRVFGCSGVRALREISPEYLNTRTPEHLQSKMGQRSVRTEPAAPRWAKTAAPTLAQPIR